MTLTFLGHATVRIDLAGTALLTDPVLRRRVAFLRWTAPEPQLVGLNDVAAVLISHLHHDHCDPRSLELLGCDRTLIAPAGAEWFLRRKGFRNVLPVEPGQTHTVGTVAVTATEAAHDGRRRPFGPSGSAVGYVVDARGRRVYFAGDTDLFPEMAGLGTTGVDVALLPVAGWGRTLGPGHLDPVRAAEAVRRLDPGLAVPVHWGALAPLWHRRRHMSAVMAPPSAFATETGRRGVSAEVAVLRPGESLTWNGPGRSAEAPAVV